MGYSGDGFNCTGMVMFDVLKAGGNCAWQIYV